MVAYDEAGNRVWQRALDIYGRVRQQEGETNFVPFLLLTDTTTRQDSPTTASATMPKEQVW